MLAWSREVWGLAADPALHTLHRIDRCTAMHCPLVQVNPRTYIGSGKVQEIMTAVANSGATTVIFDDELSPGELALTWQC
jgi:50S ribosomal subunit-associated GTPase HflX